MTRRLAAKTRLVFDYRLTIKNIPICSREFNRVNLTLRFLEAF